MTYQPKRPLQQMLRNRARGQNRARVLSNDTRTREAGDKNNTSALQYDYDQLRPNRRGLIGLVPYGETWYARQDLDFLSGGIGGTAPTVTADGLCGVMDCSQGDELYLRWSPPEQELRDRPWHICFVCYAATGGIDAARLHVQVVGIEDERPLSTSAFDAEDYVDIDALGLGSLPLTVRASFEYRTTGTYGIKVTVDTITTGASGTLRIAAIYTRYQPLWLHAHRSR